MRLGLIVPILFAAGSTPVLAAPGDGVAPSMHVAYRDLDLATPAGVARFEHRVQLATSVVCKPAAEQPGSMLRDEVTFRHCRDTALATVRPRMLAAIDRASAVAATGTPTAIANR